MPRKLPILFLLLLMDLILICALTMYSSSSIFPAEVYGIVLVANDILKRQITKPVIYTVSLSVVRPLATKMSCRNHIINLRYNAVMVVYREKLEL